MRKFFLTFLCFFWLIILGIDPTQTYAASNKDIFEIDFLDVGQGDSILVNCDGHYMLVDGGSPKASSLIFTVLKNKSISYLDYIVATHADADHVGGLAGALNYAKAGTAYCSVTEHDTKAFNSFKKYLTKQGKSIRVPSAGDSFALGSSEVTVLGPVGASKSDDANNNSIVLRIVYGETSFLLTGDAEFEEERQIMNSGATIKSTVLKVGHHGSKYSTSNTFLYKVSPEYAVISVGADNSYGHPTNEVLTRLNRRNTQVYRTDLQGDIHIVSDGKTVTFSTEKNSDSSTNDNNVTTTTNETPAPEAAPDTNTDIAAPAAAVATTETATPQGMDYILNTNTKKFHYPGCKSVKQMKDKNKQAFHGSRDEAISMGYSPCGNCDP